MIELISFGTFSKSDIDNLKITNDDFEQAINKFVAEGKTKEHKRIGYN